MLVRYRSLKSERRAREFARRISYSGKYGACLDRNHAGLLTIVKVWLNRGLKMEVAYLVSLAFHLDGGKPDDMHVFNRAVLKRDYKQLRQAFEYDQLTEGMFISLVRQLGTE